jgi:hypothetical protein
MKTNKTTAILVLAILGLGISLFADQIASPQGGNGRGIRLLPLTEAEKASLLFMWEEEKLARDVYINMFETWGAPAFSKIGVSEQRHMDAVQRLLAKYQVPNPGLDNPVGLFSNPDLQSLYDELITQGRLSLKDAYLVGKSVEEKDIADLQIALAGTAKADLIAVYTNLLNASHHHLLAFTTLLFGSSN